MTRKIPLTRLLSEYQPKPGRRFYQKMAGAPWQRQKIDRLPQTRRFGWQMAAAALLALAVLSLGIPAVRASLSAWLGLSVAPANQMPAAPANLAAVTLPAAAAPTETAAGPTPTPAPAQPDEITQLSAQAGWQILTPARLPEGYHFQSAYFETHQKMVILTYLVTRPLPGANDPTLTASSTITLLQALNNDFVPMQIAPTTNVTDVQVNGQPAAYAAGAWDAQFVPDSSDPNGGKMVSIWRNDLQIKNLYWQIGDVYLVLMTDDADVSRQALLDTAASITGP